MDAFQDAEGDGRGSLVGLGYGLGGASLLAVFALLHHPVGHGAQPADILASIRAQTGVDQVVHAALAIVFGFLAAAMAVFAGRLGLGRFTVVAGLVAFSFAFVLTVLAAMTDGFVIPAIAAHCGADPAGSCASEAMGLLRLCALQIEYLTRFSFVAIVVAVAAWSMALLSTRGVPRWAGWVGLACAGCQAAALLAVRGSLSPATLLLIFAAQVAWNLLVSLLMIKASGPFSKNSPRKQ